MAEQYINLGPVGAADAEATYLPITTGSTVTRTVTQATETGSGVNGRTWTFRTQSASGAGTLGADAVWDTGTGTTRPGGHKFLVGASETLRLSNESGIGLLARLSVALELQGTNRAGDGDIRTANNRNVLVARNAANTDQVFLVGVDASNRVNIGSNNAATSTGGAGVRLYNGTALRLDTTVTKPAVTGALTTVIDANAKAVLQSIIDALVALQLATNGTT